MAAFAAPGSGACITYPLQLRTGIYVNSRNPDKLLRYCSMFCHNLTGIFPRNNEKDVRLFRLLQNAYVGGHYKEEYSITLYEPEKIKQRVGECVSHDHFDMILMDVQMPEMNGMEATRMIRVCLEAQPVIIAMTANVMQGDREECMQSGMNDYISKPVELNELLTMLEKWALTIKEKKDSVKRAPAV